MPFALFLLGVAVFAQGTSEFMLSGLVPDIARDLGVSVPAAGALSSAFAGGWWSGHRSWPPSRDGGRGAGPCWGFWGSSSPSMSWAR